MAAQTRTTYHAEYDYPGSLFPESRSRELVAPTVGAAVAAQPDDQWYAVTIYSRDEKLFAAGDGEEQWVKVGVPTKHKFVIGTLVHYSDVPAPVDENGRDTDILISNIRCNSTDGGYGVKTRRGNWQIASDYDRVLTVEQLGMEKP